MLSEAETKEEDVFSVQQHTRHDLSYGAFSAWPHTKPCCTVMETGSSGGVRASADLHMT